MNTHFKNALNKVKAEESLIKNTQEFLIKEVAKKQEKGRVRTMFPMKKLATLVCSVILLIVCTTGAYAYYQTPVSYISVDINPSVELGVNAFDKVVKITGYNEDGLVILQNQDIIGEDVNTAVNSLITSASENGYIAEDGSTVVAITIESDDDEKVTELEEEAEEAAKEALEDEEKTAEVYKERTRLSLREEAEKYEITPGKLNLIKKLQETDSTATVEQYKDASVKEIMWLMKKDNGVRDEDKIHEPENEDEESDQDEENEIDIITPNTSVKEGKENKEENKNSEQEKNTEKEQEKIIENEQEKSIENEQEKNLNKEQESNGNNRISDDDTEKQNQEDKTVKENNKDNGQTKSKGKK
jgi:hypothetical protein